MKKVGNLTRENRIIYKYTILYFNCPPFNQVIGQCDNDLSFTRVRAENYPYIIYQNDTGEIVEPTDFAAGLDDLPPVYRPEEQENEEEKTNLQMA